MTLKVAHSVSCDVCDAPVMRAYEDSFRNHEGVAAPYLALHQWRSRGTCYDLCNTCAEPVAALIGKLFEQAHADRAVEEAR